MQALAVTKMDEHEQRVAESFEKEATMREALIATGVATEEQLTAVHQYGVDERARYAQEKRDEDVAADREAMEKKIANAQMYVDHFSATVSALTDLSDMLMERRISNGEKVSKRQRKIAKALFRAEQAASIASIVMKTAEASMAMMVYPPPVGPILAGLVGVMGAAQIATVAATPAPTFHTGGIIQSNKPGEVPITAQAGDAVLSRDVVAANGGVENVMQNARNGFGGGAVSIDLKLRHRSLDQITTEVMRAGGSTSQATRSLRPSGYNNPYSRS